MLCVLTSFPTQKALRKYWEDYTKDLSCLIYVIDSTDQERIEEAKEELFRLLELENLTEMYLLLYANKRVILSDSYFF